MPSGFFEKVKGGAEKMGEQFVGPHYNYVEYIKSPEEQGMSDKGDLGVLAKDIAGLVSYGDLLIQGKGNAKVGRAALGNRFFLATGAKCKPHNDPTSSVARYIYINNSPTGQIPFLPGKSNIFKGLLPGMIENLGAFNPMKLMQGMAQTGDPLCTEMTAPVTKGGGTETHYVALSDLPMYGKKGHKKLNLPSNVKFHDGGNNKALQNANEGFQNLNDALYGDQFKIEHTRINLKDHPLANLYTAGYSFFLIYLYFQLIKRLN